ncbi:MAG: hypothetical protein LBE13_01265, partial [Bacteroidales bacterium]|nr:hypothetical protein [Bacteroidales bacterium]
LASFARGDYTNFGEAAVQLLPDLCSHKIGFTVQIRRITQLDPQFFENINFELFLSEIQQD